MTTTTRTPQPTRNDWGGHDWRTDAGMVRTSHDDGVWHVHLFAGRSFATGNITLAGDAAAMLDTVLAAALARIGWEGRP